MDKEWNRWASQAYTCLRQNNSTIPDDVLDEMYKVLKSHSGGESSTENINQWSPIETAPKDGTEILAITKKGNMHVISYDDIFAASWRIVNDQGLSEVAPSHWLPLPAAPKVES